jgi:hypothetical protein
MRARLRSWWQKILQHHYVRGIVVLSLLVLILFIFLVYRFGWDWTGFTSGTSQITIISTSKGNYAATILQPSKSLWDWLNLLGVLAIPIVAGLGVAWFTHAQQQRDQQIADQRAESERKDIAERAKLELEKALDNQREAALQEYIDKMSELLLHEKLRESAENDEVRIVARARTLHVLRRLDKERKGSVIQFLSESRLLSLVDLSYADLSEAILFRANLSHANLFCANLRKANLFLATLDSVNLSEAYMPEADLRGASLNLADLSGAHLTYADLRGANLTGAMLANKTMERKVNLTGTQFNKKPVFLLYPLLMEGISLGPTVWPDEFGHEAAEAAGAICVDG